MILRAESDQSLRLIRCEGLTGGFAVVWDDSHVWDPLLELSDPVGDGSAQPSATPLGSVKAAADSRIRHDYETRIDLQL